MIFITNYRFIIRLQSHIMHLLYDFEGIKTRIVTREMQARSPARSEERQQWNEKNGRKKNRL